MGIQLTGFVTMIVVTLLYVSDLGWETVLKYWAVFLVLGLGTSLVLHLPTLASILQFCVAIALFSKAKFSSALD